MDSLSSSPASPYRHIINPQVNFSEDPEGALSAILLSYGVSFAEELVAMLKPVVDGNILSTISLIALTGSFGEKQAGAILRLVLGSDINTESQYLSSSSTSPTYTPLQLLASIDSLNPAASLSTYLGLSEIDPRDCYDQLSLLNWFAENFLYRQQEIAYLYSSDVLSFLVAFLKRYTKTDVTVSATAVARLSSRLGAVVAPIVIGHNLDQSLYMSYVPTVKALT